MLAFWLSPLFPPLSTRLMHSPTPCTRLHESRCFSIDYSSFTISSTISPPFSPTGDVLSFSMIAAGEGDELAQRRLSASRYGRRPTLSEFGASLSRSTIVVNFHREASSSNQIPLSARLSLLSGSYNRIKSTALPIRVETCQSYSGSPVRV